jgi:hypothetical protein
MAERKGVHNLLDLSLKGNNLHKNTQTIFFYVNLLIHLSSTALNWRTLYALCSFVHFIMHRKGAFT